MNHATPTSLGCLKLEGTVFLAACLAASLAACDLTHNLLAPGATSSGMPQATIVIGGNTTILPTLGGTIVVGEAINESGQVTGMSRLADGSEAEAHAFLYSGGAIQDLGTLGGNSSWGYGINDAGQVAGHSSIAGSYPFHAFLYSGGVMQDLGTLGGSTSNANDINNAGQVVGQSFITGDTYEHAFLYTGGVMHDLGTLGGVKSFANGINDAGQVAGSSLVAGNAAEHIFLYSGGVMQDLGTLGGSTAKAEDINSAGQIVGYSEVVLGDNASHAFLWTPGGVMQDLGTLGGTHSLATGINDYGQVIGYSLIAGNTDWHAFLWTQEDGMQDLYAVTGLELAVDINTSLQVIGGNRLVQLITDNVAPTITAITGPGPISVNTSATLSIAFSDPDALDTHSSTIDWADGVTTTHAGVTSPFNASHTYAVAGVYRVMVTLADNEGGETSESHEYVVVYDPSAGFVTGGGWINYDADACAAICAGAGRGDFGFVSKYQKEKMVPSGDTRFQFHAGSLLFESTLQEWLVVSGARAQFKGTGTINGAGDYGFLLTAVDGDVAGGGEVDRFRIKIWDRTTETVVFDNQSGAADDANLTTALGGGSILLHAPKK